MSVVNEVHPVPLTPHEERAMEPEGRHPPAMTQEVCDGLCLKCEQCSALPWTTRVSARILRATVMKWMGWRDIWYIPGFMSVPVRVFVGTWTGPEGDLICVWETLGEGRALERMRAELYLSPSSRFVFVSVLKALALAWIRLPDHRWDLLRAQRS